MGRLHPLLKVPIIAVIAAAVGFPLFSIRGDGPSAEVTIGALVFGGYVLVAGYGLLLIRAFFRLIQGPVGNVRQAVTGVFEKPAVLPVCIGLLLLLAVVYPSVMSRQHVNLGLETLIYMTLALGLNVIVGYGGLLVLGYAGFWAVGAYTFVILALRCDVNMWVALPFAGLAAMLAGLLLGLPSLRLRGDYLAIVTLGFGEVVWYLLKTEAEFTGGEMGLPNSSIKGRIQDHTSFLGSGTLTEAAEYYWLALALVIVAVYVIHRVERSRVGRALVAMREDETAARCMGINTTRLKLSAFAFAAMWAGFAGVLWAAKTDFVNPNFFRFYESILILAMVVLGGLGSIPGVMIGAIIVYAGPALLRENADWFEQHGLPDFQTYRLLIFGAVLVILMIFRPQGLLGSARLRVQMGGSEEAT
jgi:branched-chain amino acid transport system permease protein